jgi:hypothetical protein
MNENRDADNLSSAHDGEVRAAYRRLAAEQPPASLDRAIQAEARAAVGNWRPRWLAPAALAATALLSLALVMRMATGPQPMVIRTAPGDAPLAEQKARPASVPDMPKRESAGLQNASPTADAMTTEVSAQGSADAALAEPERDERRQRLATLDGAGENPLEDNAQEVARSGAARAMPPAVSLSRALVGPEVNGCSEIQRGSPTVWIQCMRELAASRDKALSVELDAWRAQHPDLPLPGDLATPD